MITREAKRRVTRVVVPLAAVIALLLLTFFFKGKSITDSIPATTPGAVADVEEEHLPPDDIKEIAEEEADKDVWNNKAEGLVGYDISVLSIRPSE